MRLRALLADEPRSVLEALESSNIKTDEDFLCSESNLLSIYRRIPPNSLSYAHLERLRERVLDAMADPGCTAAEMLEKTEARTRWKTDMERLPLPLMDVLLRSMEIGIVEVSGGKGSMKSVRKASSSRKLGSSSIVAVAHRLWS